MTQEPGAHESDRLTAALLLLRRHARLLTVCALLGALGGAGSALARPAQRSCTSRVVVNDPGASAVFSRTDGGTSADVNLLLQTQLQLARSPAVLSAAQSRLAAQGVTGVTLPAALTVVIVPNTRLMSFTGTAGSAGAACAVMAASRDAYLAEFSREVHAQGALEAAAVQSKADQLQATLARRQAASASSTELAALRTQLDALDTTLSQVEVDTAVRAQSASVVGAQRPRATPVPRGTLRGVLLGLLAGLSLAGAGVLLAGGRIGRVRAAADLHAVGDLPVLGVVPRAGEERSATLPTLRARTSPQAEAYRLLAANTEAALLDRGLSGGLVLMVTSAVRTPVSSVAAANLAVVLAGLTGDAVLVCADLYDDARCLLAPGEPGLGLSTALRGDGRLSLLRPAEAGTPDGLHVVPGGTVREHPSELVAGRRMTSVLEELRNDDHVVVLDVAPVLQHSDASALAPYCDAALLVTEEGGRLQEAVEAHERLRRLRLPVLGWCLHAPLPGAAAEPVPLRARFASADALPADAG